MNRSILIVICDFLVLSAMSLSIGVGETASTPRGSTVISRTAALDIHIEQMHKELRKRAQIQSEKVKIEEEKSKAEAELERLRTQLAQLAGDVDSRTMKLNETSKALLATRTTLQEKEKALEEREKELAKQNDALKNALASVQDVSAKYEQANTELQQARKEAAARATELKQSNENLAAVSGKLKTTEGKLRETEIGLSYAKGSLNRTEKELADSKKREETATKTLYTRGVELEQTRVELANTKRLLDAAVRNLTKTQGELDRTKQNLADSASRLSRTQENLSRTQENLFRTRENLSRIAAESKARAENLADTRRRLAATEKLLRSDALTAYSAAAVQLAFHLKNARFMNDFELNETLYAPEISIGGKTYLPGAFRSLTGLLKRYAGYTRIVELAYSMKKTGVAEQTVFLPGPLWSLNAEPRACLFEVEKPAGTPLKAISGAELKKRGLQNLTLFKSSHFGTETASLNGRCSLPLEENNSYLHIRNSLRSASELPAEIGDYVISKEGEFIGVVVSVSENTIEGREDALCYLYPPAINRKDATALPLTRNKGAEYYTGFTDALQNILQKVTTLDRNGKIGK